MVIHYSLLSSIKSCNRQKENSEFFVETCRIMWIGVCCSIMPRWRATVQPRSCQSWSLPTCIVSMSAPDGAHTTRHGTLLWTECSYVVLGINLLKADWSVHKSVAIPVNMMTNKVKSERQCPDYIQIIKSKLVTNIWISASSNLDFSPFFVVEVRGRRWSKVS